MSKRNLYRILCFAIGLICAVLLIGRGGEDLKMGFILLAALGFSALGHWWRSRG